MVPDMGRSQILDLVEQVVVFYSIPPSYALIPKLQKYTTDKDAVLMENFISVKCFHSIRKGWGLSGLVACASSAGCNRTLIGQHDLAAANGWVPGRMTLSNGVIYASPKSSACTAACVHAWANTTPSSCGWRDCGWLSRYNLIARNYH